MEESRKLEVLNPRTVNDELSRIIITMIDD